MATSTTMKDILGLFAFAVFWVLAVFPAAPFLPIGRTAGSLLGAMLMVLFKIMTPDQAYEAVDLSILTLLFGTMVVSIYLEKADAFNYLNKLLTWKNRGPKDLICRICLVSAITSAFFTNDTSCMALTKSVFKITQQNDLPPLPFLLALASSANIGSSATPIGNPQNLVVAINSGISFGEFLSGLLPATLVGVFVNALVLLCMFWNLLSVQKSDEDLTAIFLEEERVDSYQFSPATTSQLTSLNDEEHSSRFETIIGNLDHVEITGNHVSPNEQEMHSISNSVWGLRNSNVPERWKRVLRKSCVYLVILGMLISFLVGENMSWTAITAALALVVLDFKDAGPCLEKVSYSLFVFFCGMFITVEGLNKTGIPSLLWDSVDDYTQIDTAGGVAVVSLVILLLSNLISNVPTVLLLGSRMAAAAAMISTAYEKKAWLILAWVSSVAGNLSLLGSAANLIVCDQAHRALPVGYTLTFWNHLKFGLPSTVIVIAIGVTLIR